MLEISDDEDEGELVSDDHDIKCPETELHLYLECGKAKDVLRFWEKQQAGFSAVICDYEKDFLRSWSHCWCGRVI